MINLDTCSCGSGLTADSCCGVDTFSLGGDNQILVDDNLDEEDEEDEDDDEEDEDEEESEEEEEAAEGGTVAW